MERWKGKVAVVTGASSGIGAAIVKTLLEHDVIVVGMARRKELIDQLSTSKNLHSLKVDVTKEEEIIDAFKWVADHLGVIHILVNSVGTVWLSNSFHSDTKFWRNTIDTDLLGLLIPTKIVIEQMIANNIDGHIIHINGITGQNVYIPNLMALTASKSAVTSATEYLRRELLEINSKIKISSISPGAVDTSVSKTNFELQPALSKLSTQYKQLIKLDVVDVANAFLYILSTPPHVQVHNIIIRAVGSPL